MEKKENLYAQFDARVVQELEQRNEFGWCDSGCLLGIGEIVGGGLIAIFAPPTALGASATLVVAGVDDVRDANNGCGA